MVTITFETVDGDTFAHIWSTDGVLGHAAEVKEKIPRGTWLTMPSRLSRLTPWMVKKCGFRWVARILHNHDVVEVLQKE